MLFGKEIEAQIAYMVENCKLAPEADAQLHTIIANPARVWRRPRGNTVKAACRRGGQGRPGCQRLRQVF